MIETPDYDQMVAEYGDPAPVLDELTDALEATPPEIDEAHGVIDVGKIEPVSDPGASDDSHESPELNAELVNRDEDPDDTSATTDPDTSDEADEVIADA